MLHTGDRFQTGQIAPVSAVYKLVDCAKCLPAQKEIPLAQDARFPPCRSCIMGEATWEFVRFAELTTPRH